MPHCPSESMEAPPVSWSALGYLDLLGECMLGICIDMASCAIPNGTWDYLGN